MRLSPAREPLGYRVRTECEHLLKTSRRSVVFLSVDDDREPCKFSRTDRDRGWRRQTRVRPRNHAFDRGARRRHLANTMNRFVRRWRCETSLPLLYIATCLTQGCCTWQKIYTLALRQPYTGSRAKCRTACITVVRMTLRD